MTDHPLLFRPEMVRALLDGRKTMTRRPAWRWAKRTAYDPDQWKPTAARRIKVGDLVWVKENIVKTPAGIAYAADGADHYGAGGRLKITPSIHMPRVASRLTLVVTGVKIERLLDISDNDAIAEGVTMSGAIPGQDFDVDGQWWPGGPRSQYRRLYERIHGKGEWAVNPEVVALTFTVHTANIDAFKKKEAA